MRIGQGEQVLDLGRRRGWVDAGGDAATIATPSSAKTHSSRFSPSTATRCPGLQAQLAAGRGRTSATACSYCGPAHGLPNAEMGLLAQARSSSGRTRAQCRSCCGSGRSFRAVVGTHGRSRQPALAAFVVFDVAEAHVAFALRRPRRGRSAARRGRSSSLSVGPLMTMRPFSMM